MGDGCRRPDPDVGISDIFPLPHRVSGPHSISLEIPHPSLSLLASHVLTEPRQFHYLGTAWQSVVESEHEFTTLMNPLMSLCLLALTVGRVLIGRSELRQWGGIRRQAAPDEGLMSLLPGWRLRPEC